MPDNFFDVVDISTINMDLIVTQLPGAPTWSSIENTTQGKYISAFLASEDILKAEGINTAMRLAHFLGQGLIESNFFRATEENLNYSAVALRATWPGRFPTDAFAEEYARQPEKIANFVYANRMENGDEASGDGWRYRGRGIIQLTGRQNYRIFGDLLGLQLEDDPDILTRDFRAALHVAAKFFSENNLLALADADDAKKISRAINRGNANSSSPAHGEDDRIWWTAKALDLFRKEEDDLLNPREGGKLTIGHKGARVEEFQRMLAGLGFAVGGFDGDFGPAPQRAVIAFQQQADLPVTGIIDKATALAMDEALTGQPTPNNRVNADENTVRETGSETPDDTNQIAAAGVAAGVAAAAAAASELLDGEEEAAPTTNTETQTPQTPPTTSGGVNWILIGCLLIVVVAVTVIFLRARKIKKDQVKDYQEGKIV
ncbi:MAG: hypothetical protein CMK03_11525 [Ponticaulis sp.]|nr:hypothetical protein [Ponticaulis sp.]